MVNYSTNATADKFYTDPAVAKECIDHFDLEQFDLIIEPSAGSWAFGRHLPKEKTYCFDLFPDENYPETIEQDFLKFNLQEFIKSKDAKNVLIIGNPPYGRLSGLALKFVKKSCINYSTLFGNIKTTVAFVLSETFAKVSFSSRIPTTHTLTHHKSLGSPFFLFGDEEQPYKMINTGLFVWEPVSRLKEIKVNKSRHLTFHKKSEFLTITNEDKCAIRGQGSGAGQVFWNDFEQLSETTTRFCSGPGVHVLEKIDWTPYTKMTVGIPSLATKEILFEIEKYYANNK